VKYNQHEGSFTNKGDTSLNEQLRSQNTGANERERLTTLCCVCRHDREVDELNTVHAHDDMFTMSINDNSDLFRQSRVALICSLPLINFHFFDFDFSCSVHCASCCCESERQSDMTRRMRRSISTAASSTGNDDDDADDAEDAADNDDGDDDDDDGGGGGGGGIRSCSSSAIMSAGCLVPPYLNTHSLRWVPARRSLSLLRLPLLLLLLLMLLLLLLPLPLLLLLLLLPPLLLPLLLLPGSDDSSNFSESEEKSEW
jgi:hypothetical protein